MITPPRSPSSPSSSDEPRVAGRCLQRLAPLALVLLALASPAAAQFSRVKEIPAENVFCVDVDGDVIAAGAATAVFVSSDGGTTWRRSAPLAPAVALVQAVRLHQGRLFAGTAGQGVFVSADLGATWSPFNQGLTGGILNTQLDVSSLEVAGNSLLAGTLGAGVYMRRLTTTGSWTHFGDVFEPEQASNINAVVLGGTRVLAAGGSNGEVFLRDPGDADWRPSGLGPDGFLPGLQAQSACWTGHGWVVGTSLGLFLSATGEEPWTLSSLGVLRARSAALAMRGPTLFAAFNLPGGTVILSSPDEGQSWRFVAAEAGAFVFALAAHDHELYAARADGLWHSRSHAIAAPVAQPAPSVPVTF